MSDKENQTSLNQASLNEIIKLSFPIKINGVTTDQLVMRRMSTKDQRIAWKLSKGDNAEFEFILLCRLTDCAPNDLEELDFADYRKLQRAFQRLSTDPHDSENT
ncbi:phage tail assembly protein [Nitrosomonas sp.]|uniref:phage tail assembly protein n=1 Tax=Nitrosomonas sp. TaxID=42353 RepID=UPI0025EE87B8|nr:phage tail assembly protein [Nitrosomonas sp.]MBV6447300.1 hypothetical protein [Nitrosomonas sp.]